MAGLAEIEPVDPDDENFLISDRQFPIAELEFGERIPSPNRKSAIGNRK
jgi:hypothetical protein